MALLGSAALALSLTACGGPAPANGGGDAGGDGGLRTVNVVGVPVVDMAALYVGIDQGYFEEEGLELNIEFGQGTAAMIPALLNGQYDIQYGGSINVLQAVDSGIPIEAIAVGGRTTGVQGEDHGGLLVLDDSPIQDAGDLEGKTVAVNALRGLHEAALYASISKAGGDPTKVSFVEMALPDMGAALESGQIDAASTSEPWLGVLEGQGARLIASLYVDADPAFVTAIYFAASEKIQSDPELIEKFTRALEKSFEYSNANPDEVRAELGNFTEIDPELAETMILTNFDWGLSYDDLFLIAELAAEAGSLEDPETAAANAARYLESQ
ncbi:hypothetical protein GCM10010921_27560 [Microbacterium album]|uniref:Solute-binding protein family 3/N-terminal domain-containing protein n=2 Tax=Microbacterium album TaxID=2053191 RepID=A0A917IHR6_9MICO|nr:hypothetical protein GCM10010921_27560 [Microbacterium album]